MKKPLHIVESKKGPLESIIAFETTEGTALLQNSNWPSVDDDFTFWSFKSKEYHANMAVLLRNGDSTWFSKSNGHWNSNSSKCDFAQMIDGRTPADEIDRIDSRAFLRAVRAMTLALDDASSSDTYLTGVAAIGVSRDASTMVELPIDSLATMTMGASLAVKRHFVQFMAAVLTADEYRRENGLAGSAPAQTQVRAWKTNDGTWALRIDTCDMTVLFETAVTLKPYYDDAAVSGLFLHETARRFRATGSRVRRVTSSVFAESKEGETDLAALCASSRLSLARVTLTLSPLSMVTSDSDDWKFAEVPCIDETGGPTSWALVEAETLRRIVGVEDEFYLDLPAGVGTGAPVVIRSLDGAVQIAAVGYTARAQS